jgi:hypothetical protein
VNCVAGLTQVKATVLESQIVICNMDSEDVLCMNKVFRHGPGLVNLNFVGHGKFTRNLRIKLIHVNLAGPRAAL